MKSEEFKQLQAPLKEKYRNDPQSAQATLKASGTVNFDVIAVNLIRVKDASDVPGLHPMAGGDGRFACAAEMLLEAIIGCAGVTFAAVCSAMNFPVESATLNCHGDMDFQGTLGTDRSAPVGFSEIRLQFEVDSSESDEKISKAVELAERYCVVAQSVRSLVTSWSRKN